MFHARHTHTVSRDDNIVSDCPTHFPLPVLSGPISCHIPELCTGVDCCVDVNLLSKSFHAFVYLDACNQMLNIGIEKLAFNLTMFNYEWGKHEQFYLQRMVRIE
jgi:hypothetical protein